MQHPLAVLAELAVRGVLQVDAPEQLFRARRDAPLRHAVQAPVESQHFAAAEPVVKPEVLGQEAHLRARAAMTERRAEQLAVAGGRLDQPQEHLERRGLARAVRPQESEHLAPADLERQLRNRYLGAELLAEAAGLDDGAAHAPPGRCGAPRIAAGITAPTRPSAGLPCRRGRSSARTPDRARTTRAPSPRDCAPRRVLCRRTS